MSSLIVVTGPPGAGKSAVATLLAERFGRSALVAGDAFFGFLATGAIEPWLPESREQNEVVIGAAAVAAGQFVVAGYVTVYDGVIGPWFVPQFLAAAKVREMHYAVLLPSEETCVTRVATRRGHGFADEAATRKMHGEFAAHPVDESHVIVTDTWSVEQTVEAVLKRVSDGSLLVQAPTSRSAGRARREAADTRAVRWDDDLVEDDGPSVWVARHADVRLRPVDEQDLELLTRIDTEPALSEPFEWRGFRDPKARRRRWEQDSYLGSDDALLIVALPDGSAAGIVSWRTALASGPRVSYDVGILLLPEHRHRGVGSSAQCLLADYLFYTTLASRVEATTAVENLAEQRALENAGFQKEGRLRGAGYLQGRIQDGFLYSRLRTDPHP